MVPQIKIGPCFLCPVTIGERRRAGVDDTPAKIIIGADRVRPYVAPFCPDPQVERAETLGIIDAEIGKAIALCFETVGKGNGTGNVAGGHIELLPAEAGCNGQLIAIAKFVII